MTNEEAMNRVLELALKGSGQVSPNPRVGAIILKNDELISEGWHHKFGEPHAEVMAIRNAKEIDLEGSTMVVNLEPCSHQGKTPPCADLLIEKKFKEVIIGMQDPNPLVAGKGIAKLENAGIKVKVGILEEKCKWINRFFIKHISTKMPYIVMKVAQSFDGKIATASGESQWITSLESRKYTHYLRNELDAVLIGSGTAIADNPELNVRHIKGRNPIKIVLDTNLQLNPDLKLFNNDTKTIICCSNKIKIENKLNHFANFNVDILPCKIDSSGRIDLQYVLSQLSNKYSIASILIEGGSEIFSSFLKSNLIDELHLFTAPKIIGKGKSSFDSFSINKLNEAPEFKIKEISHSGKDIHIIALNKD